MHKNFGEWYRLVSIEPDGAKLSLRWAGAETWAAQIRTSNEDLLDTVRIFQGISPRTSRDAFLAAFQSQDPAFPKRNDLELQVLAGASLVACVQAAREDDGDLNIAIIAGSAVEASSLLATEPRLDEIAREVVGGLQTIAIKRRERRLFDPSAISRNADKAEEGIKQVAAATAWDQLKAAAMPVFQSLLHSIRAADRELCDAAHNLQCADEETNIVWWLEGGFSRDTNKPWAALKNGMAIIAGSELADLTDVELGPRNAEALLERVLAEAKAKGKEAGLAIYVNALPEEWVKERAGRADGNALDLTPISMAISHRGRSDADSWQQYFDASSGMKSTIQLTPAQVAHQAYVEAILLRALADSDSEE